MCLDQPAGACRGKAHDAERSGEAAVHHRHAPAEIGRDQVPEGADQIVGDAPADELREAENDDGAWTDQADLRESRPGLPSCGSVVAPAPSSRCISTVSTQRPSLKPTAFSVPTGRKPSARCSPIEPLLALSPITAIIWRHGPASQRRIRP